MSDHPEAAPPLPFRRKPLERDPGLPEGDGLPDDPDDWPDREIGPLV
jgi:hypothetical protein